MLRLQKYKVVVQNAQSSPAPVPFQQLLTLDLSDVVSQPEELLNLRFCADNGYQSPLYAWVESYNSDFSSVNVWVKIPYQIPANSQFPLYVTKQSVIQYPWTGMAPQLTSTYAQYDNGENVFLYYNVNPSSTSGWTISGSAGVTTAPNGSHFSSPNAFYAYSSVGDYMYTSIPTLAENVIISFNVYTTGLGDLYFLVNSSGAGQMARLDGRGGGNYSGLATTNSWTSWNAPSSGLDTTTNTWYKYDVVIAGNQASAYIGSISNSLATLGSLANSLTISNNGNYLGFVGDGLGSSYITYWNGIIIRAYPPAGVMPSLVAFLGV